MYSSAQHGSTSRLGQLHHVAYPDARIRPLNAVALLDSRIFILLILRRLTRIRPLNAVALLDSRIFILLILRRLTRIRPLNAVALLDFMDGNIGSYEFVSVFVRSTR